MKAILCLAASAIALAGCSYSSHGSAENRSFERAGIVAAGDLNASGNADYAGVFVDAGGVIDRDLTLSGANVVSDASVGGNLEIEGARIRFTGRVNGDAEITGATMYLDGYFGGRLEVLGARATIDGDILGALDAMGARFNLEGRFAQPVHVVGSRGDNGNGRNGRVVISGNLEQGGYICATQVDFRAGASASGPLVVVAENRPDWDGDINYLPLNGRDCEDVARG
ncbi:hypothetical protein V0U79_01030 [Hyphobacterium sp. HN65]|uniref:Polymer-forming cytoskeletal protein n=1 Tax=Hyphobacterium lacteum TaxID=3116575 RepID=A0ABU7LMW5_9PROT|nr:hypothetical protein [Hyphobacterium sp. HN65]MEE2524934.1 hypothetical protein [Hyphobacterium sp. HN65]